MNRLRRLLRRLLVGHRLRDAIKRNQAAADRLDRAIREVLAE